MKHFHLFSGSQYYPAGFNDYKGSYATLEEAQAAFTPDIASYDWADIAQSLPDGSLQHILSGELQWETGVVAWEIVPLKANF